MCGYTAILYSKYSYEIESSGKSFTQTGRATETFVLRQGKWFNTGWHLDSGTQARAWNLSVASAYSSAERGRAARIQAREPRMKGTQRDESCLT